MRRYAVLFVAVGIVWPGFAFAQDEDAPTESTTDEMSVERDCDGGGEDCPSEDDFAWWFRPYGYVRAGYELIQSDPNYDFVGRNSGFSLLNARLGLEGGNSDWGASFRISVDGAADRIRAANSAQGDLDVQLRDAYISVEPVPFFGIRAGQFKLPFSGEDLRSTGDLVFITRAVGQAGVLPGRGFEQAGILVDRDLGVMLYTPQYYVGPFGFAINFAVSNGNGANQLLNDNDKLAITARAELYWEDLVRVGFAFIDNGRTTGTLPNLFEEIDQGWTTDLLVSVLGLEIYGQLTSMTTSFDTAGTDDNEQFAYHAQITYEIDQIPVVTLAPAFRYAYFHPRAEGGVTTEGVDLDSFELSYLTFGLRAWVPPVPVTLNLNYTITGEQAPRELENNRFEALLQVVF
ncbi:MAG: hypothetical protein KC561_08535 [Myxococcales bacterium]|nr:hypothetical protein [Myxococcales bacterium]